MLETSGVSTIRSPWEWRSPIRRIEAQADGTLAESEEDQSSAFMAGQAAYLTKPMFLEQDTVRKADGTVD